MKHLTVPVTININITQFTKEYLKAEVGFYYNPVKNVEEMLKALERDDEPLCDYSDITINDDVISPNYKLEIAYQVFQEYCRLKNK